MTTPLALTRDFAVSPVLTTQGFAQAAALGYRTIISFLTADEAGTMPVSAIRQAALAHGLDFVHIPAAKYDVLTAGVLTKARTTLDNAQGPVLGMCATGQRAAIVWAGAMARTMPVDTILKTLEAAGMDFGFLRDDLETEAHRALWAAPHETEKELSRAAA